MTQIRWYVMELVNFLCVRVVFVTSVTATAASQRKLRVVKRLSCLLVYVPQAACNMHALAGVG